jgi:hypothetical protein
MGVVCLQRSRVAHEQLPGLCLRCGTAATVRRPTTFSKPQEWTFVLFFLGGIPYFLGRALFRNRLRVTVPLCDRHRHHFAWQTGIAWGGAALVAALLAGCFALMGEVADATLNNCFAGVGIVAVVWVVALLVNRLSGITSATVDDEKALIVGVSDRFARAWEQAGQEVMEVE